MRAFFLLLVLGNLAFFAWANFYTEADTQSDPRPLARQIEPQKLRVVPSSTAPKSASATGGKPSADPVQGSAARAACLELGGFPAAEAARAGEALAPLGLEGRLAQRQVDDSASWWVFMAPRGSRQDAQKKAAELKALGIDDYFILQDEGPLRYALSLGVFKTQAAATARLEALREKGVKTAQVGPRDTSVQKTYFQVRSVDDALAAKLREIAQSFQGIELRECQAAPA